MADTINWQMGAVWNLPPRTVQDYCSEIANFLRTNPGAWTKGVGARTGDGTACHPNNPHARSFCMLGLIERFVEPGMRAKFVDHLTELLPGMFRGMPIYFFNDHEGRTVDDVIRCFAMAAATPKVEVPQSKQVVYFEPKWNTLAIPTAEDIAKYKAELAEATKKLVPWETIMEKIEREAA
jgi:hypothetical protein